MHIVQRIVIAACALSTLTLVSCDSDVEERNIYKLYFLGGQSNMDGYGYVAELPDELRGQVDRVMIFKGRPGLDKDVFGGTGTWAPLRPGFGMGFQTNGKSYTLAERFGPELAFGVTLSARQPGSRIALVKYSLGGSGLGLGVGYGDWFPEYRGSNRPNQFDHALTTIRNALSNSDIDGDDVPDLLVPTGIIWMQGEADASNTQEAADTYQGNLTRLMQLLRATLRVENLPVVIGKISDSGMDDDGLMMENLETVQEAQVMFVESDQCAALVSITEELDYLDDAWHYDTDGFIRLGSAFAEAVLELEKTCP